MEKIKKFLMEMTLDPSLRVEGDGSTTAALGQGASIHFAKDGTVYAIPDWMNYDDHKKFSIDDENAPAEILDYLGI